MLLIKSLSSSANILQLLLTDAIVLFCEGWQITQNTLSRLTLWSFSWIWLKIFLTFCLQVCDSEGNRHEIQLLYSLM